MEARGNWKKKSWSQSRETETELINQKCQKNPLQFYQGNYFKLEFSRQVYRHFCRHVVTLHRKWTQEWLSLNATFISIWNNKKPKFVPSRNSIEPVDGAMDQNISHISEKSSRSSSLNDIDVKTEVQEYSPNPAQNNETEFWKNVFIFIQIKLYVQKIQYIPVDGDICSTFENSFSANFWFIIAQHHSRKSKMDENGKKFKVNFLPVFQNFTNGFSLGSYDGLQPYWEQWISFTNEQARFWMILNKFFLFLFWKSKFKPNFQIIEFIRRELIYLQLY